MELNEKLIKDIPAKNETAEALFTLWATRDRNAREGRSTLQETKRQLQKEGYVVVPAELRSIFRDLHKAGAGVLQGNTFKWSRHTGLKELAKIAFDRDMKASDLQSKRQAPRDPKSDLRAYKVIVVHLTNDRKAKLELPGDITPEESKFVETLVGHA